MHRIDINLQPSAYFKWLLCLITLGSLFISFSLPVHILIRFFLASIVIIYAVSIFYSGYWMKSKKSIAGLLFNDGNWQIFCLNKRLDVKLCGESTVTNWVSVLRFQVLNTRQKYTSIIFKDAMNAEDYRRLIVLLRTTRAYQAERTRKSRFA